MCNGCIEVEHQGGIYMKEWVKESVFYHIYPIGFCGAPEINSDDSEAVNRISKLEEWIPYLKELGINALYLGPIFQSNKHGYDTADYNKIDTRLGTNEDFKKVSSALHENGIKVVLDGVFNHVGRDFWAFKDVQQNGQNSSYAGWFHNINFNGRSPYGDNFSYDGWGKHYDLVKLNLKNSEVKKHLLYAVGYWIEEYDIDGLRLDAADCIDMDFFKELKAFCREKKSDFWLMGEIIHGDYNRWANKDTLDSVTNYESYKGIYSSHNDKNYFEIAYSLNRQFGNGGIYKNLDLYNFVDNHDVSRIASVLQIPEYIYNSYTILFTMPGVPSIYYGSEYGIKGVKIKETDVPLRPEINLEDIPKDNRLLDLIKKLCKIRTEHEELQYGNYEQVMVKNKQLAYSRTFEDKKLIIVLNLDEEESVVEFKVSGGKEVIDILNDDEKFDIEDNKININVPPFSSRILELR